MKGELWVAAMLFIADIWRFHVHFCVNFILIQQPWKIWKTLAVTCLKIIENSLLFSLWRFLFSRCKGSMHFFPLLLHEFHLHCLQAMNFYCNIFLYLLLWVSLKRPWTWALSIMNYLLCAFHGWSGFISFIISLYRRKPVSWDSFWICFLLAETSSIVYLYSFILRRYMSSFLCWHGHLLRWSYYLFTTVNHNSVILVIVEIPKQSSSSCYYLPII